jgi:hypothetical protein
MKSGLVLYLLTTVVLGLHQDLLPLKRSDLGKKLLSSIELQLTLEGPADKVLELLRSLEDGLAQEQTDQTSYDDQFQAECSQTLEGFSSELTRAETDKSEAVRSLAVVSPVIADAVGRLKDVSDQTQATMARKEAAIVTREDEHQAYLGRVQEHHEAIEACDLATAEVLELRSSSFLQKPPGLLQLSTHLSSIRHIAPAYSSLFKLLLQVIDSPQANQEMVARLITLITKLRDSFSTSAQLETDDESTAQHAHDELVNSLDGTTAELTRQGAELEIQISSSQSQRDAAEDRKADAEGRIVAYTTLCNDKASQCRAEQANYESETARRSEELATIKEASTLISTRLGDLSEHVSSKLTGE